MEALPVYTSSSLPAYSPNPRLSNSAASAASADTSASNSPRVSTEEYQYKNGNLLLNLGPKRPGMFRPAFGWNGIIDGYVEIRKNTKGIRSIVVVAEGHVTTGLTERGFLTDQTRTAVLRASQTLFDSSSGEKLPTQGAHYAFSFPIPTYATGGSQPLPPSFAALCMGLAADITYFIRVEMIRKSKLRQNERIKAFFYYLPRTYAPSPHRELPSVEGEKHAVDDQPDEQQRFEILPRAPEGGTMASAIDLRVFFAVPRPLVYASGNAIPFFLSISFGAMAEATSSLLTSLSVQLIRVTTLQVGSRWTACETTLGGGEVFRVEERGDEKIMFGSVTCSKMGESGWRVNSIEVKHLIRVRLSPLKNVPSLASILPIYLHDVAVTMKTHQQSLGGIEDTTVPATCRMPHPLAVGL